MLRFTLGQIPVAASRLLVIVISSGANVMPDAIGRGLEETCRQEWRHGTQECVRQVGGFGIEEITSHYRGGDAAGLEATVAVKSPERIDALEDVPSNEVFRFHDLLGFHEHIFRRR